MTEQLPHRSPSAADAQNKLSFPLADLREITGEVTRLD